MTRYEWILIKVVCALVGIDIAFVLTKLAPGLAG